MIFIVHQIDDV